MASVTYGKYIMANVIMAKVFMAKVFMAKVLYGKWNWADFFTSIILYIYTRLPTVWLQSQLYGN